MATTPPSDDDLKHPVDPAQLGAPQGLGSTPEEEPTDMSPVLAKVENGPRIAGQSTASTTDDAPTQQGSDFDQQRRQSAGGSDDRYGTVGRTQGMGRAGYNGDEDRGYDQSGLRGGLGTAGGREDLSDRHFDADTNPFTGGYGGGDYNQPDESQTKHLGLNSPNPTDEPASSPKEDPA